MGLEEFDPASGSTAPQEHSKGLIPQPGDGPTTSTQSRHMVLIDQVIDWMLMHPGAPISKAAKCNSGPFDLSPMWLRQVASADAFKARLAQKQKDVDAFITMPTIKERLASVTETALERMEQMLPVATDPEFVRDATEMLLEQHYKIGIQPQDAAKGGTTINIDARTVAIVESRKRILEGKAVSALPDIGDSNGRLASEL